MGELTVEASSVPIYSIEIHLLRVESIMVGEKIVTETSIVQTNQAHTQLLRIIILSFFTYNSDLKLNNLHFIFFYR